MRLMRKRQHQRWGSATVEMAVVTPLLLTMLFGIIEYGWVFSVRQAMVHAAREGARTASLPGSTTSQIETRVGEQLTPLGLEASEYSLTITRSTPTNPVERVDVQVPYSNITLVGGFFGATDYNLSASCSMRKEGVD
jgi:Flp pilus assembly protein TadG